VLNPSLASPCHKDTSRPPAFRAVGHCELVTTPRGAIAGLGGLLKLIFGTDNRSPLGVHCFGDIASEVLGLGQVVIPLGGTNCS